MSLLAKRPRDTTANLFNKAVDTSSITVTDLTVLAAGVFDGTLKAEGDVTFLGDAFNLTGSDVFWNIEEFQLSGTLHLENGGLDLYSTTDVFQGFVIIGEDYSSGTGDSDHDVIVAARGSVNILSDFGYEDLTDKLFRVAFRESEGMMSEDFFQCDRRYGIRVYQQTGDPATGEKGGIFYDLATNKLKVYNGTAWETITSAVV